MKQIACPHCDALLDIPEQLLPKQEVFCPRCHSYLFEQHRFGTQRCLAYSMTAMILLLLACIYPFLTFEASGQSRTISLLEASYDLFAQNFWLLSVLVFLFILIIPLSYLCFLMGLMLSRIGFFSKATAIFCARSLSYFLPWAMADVFIVGVLVALIKVIELADIIFGIAFWAYIGFTLLFIMTSSIANKYQIWLWVEEVNEP